MRRGFVLCPTGGSNKLADANACFSSGAFITASALFFLTLLVAALATPQQSGCSSARCALSLQV